MGRTGARWSLAGAEAILLCVLSAPAATLRPKAFHLEQKHQRKHLSRYADGTAPDPLPRRCLQQRLVK